MTNENARKWLSDMLKNFDLPQEQQQTALEQGIKALELLDTLTDRPCSVCRHHKENGCCKWDCVFDGYYGGKK